MSNHTVKGAQDLPVSLVIAKAARALAVLKATPTDPNAQREATEWAGPLAVIADRMAIGTERKRTNAKGGSGRPLKPYLVEHEQSGAVVVWGLSAAAAQLNVSPGTINNGLSRAKWYETRDRSGDNEWVVRVRRCTAEEEAELAAQRDANAKAEVAEELAQSLQ